jgi:hypothetical protein
MRTRSTDRLFSMVLAGGILMIAAVTTAQNTEWWPVAGHDLFNTHSQPEEDQISAANAAALVEKWSLTTAGNVTAASNGVRRPTASAFMWLRPTRAEGQSR